MRVEKIPNSLINEQRRVREESRGSKNMVIELRNLPPSSSLTFLPLENLGGRNSKRRKVLERERERASEIDGWNDGRARE